MSHHTKGIKLSVPVNTGLKTRVSLVLSMEVLLSSSFSCYAIGSNSRYDTETIAQISLV